MNQQLLSYISEQLEAGLGYQDIETALLGVGWDEAEVKQALASFTPKHSGTPSVATTASTSQAPVSQPQATVAEAMPAIPADQPTNQAVATPASPSQADVQSSTTSDNSELASVVGEAAVSRAATTAPVDTFAPTSSNQPLTTPPVDTFAPSTPSVEPASAQPATADPAPNNTATPNGVTPGVVGASMNNTSQTSLPPTSTSQPASNNTPPSGQASSAGPVPVNSANQPSPVATTPSASPNQTPVASLATPASAGTDQPLPQQNLPGNTNQAPVSAQVPTQPSGPTAQAAPPAGTVPVQAPTYSYPLTQPAPSIQQPYQAPAMTPGYPSPAGYNQPTQPKANPLSEIFKNKIVIAIIAGVVALLLIVVITVALTGGKKGDTSTNTNTGQSNSNSLVESEAFTSDRGGFSINPPKGWKAQELSSTNDIVVTITKDTTDKSKISSMTITVSALDDSQAAIANLDSFVDLYKTNATQANPLVKVNEDQKVDLNGLPARILDIDSVNDSTKVTGYMVYAIQDKKLYQIQALTFDVTPGNENKRAMHESIMTFKLNNSSAVPSASPSPTTTTKP